MANSSHSIIKNIALSGDVGTGTTTLGRNLAATLGWKHVNAGDYFRQWHREKGIPLENVHQIPEELDRELDQRFKNDMASMDNTVFESHLAGWLAKDVWSTFKILCVADEAVTMPRIAAREGWSLEEATTYSQTRTKRLNEKFEKLYQVQNPYDPTFFNAVIDTTKMSAGQVLDEALRTALPHLSNGHELAEVLDIS